jgi:PAS domain S-box-containing protein
MTGFARSVQTSRPDAGLWLWAAAWGILALLLVLIAVSVQRREFDDARASALRDLASVAALKTDQVATWRRERLADARLLTMARSPLFEGEAQLAMAAAPDPGARERLARRLEQIRAILGYQAVLIAAPDGRLRFGTGAAPSMLDPASRDLVHQAANSAEALMGPLSPDPALDATVAKGGAWIDAAAAYRGTNGEVRAVLLLRSAASAKLFPLLQRWPTRSASAETLLVAREVDEIVFLNPLRHVTDAPFARRRPTDSMRIVGAKAARGQAGAVEGVDYRGVEVLANLQAVPDSDWFMVAKIDAAEVLANARERSLGVMLLVVAAMLTLGLALLALMAVQRRNAWRARFRAEHAERLALEEYQATLRGIGDGVLSSDAAGRVRYMNPVAEALTGWTEAQAAGRPVQEVFRILNEDTRAEVESPVARVLHDGVVVGLANHTLLVARDGSERPIADSGAPVRRHDGTLAGVVLVFRDQTEERAAMRALRASEQRFRRLFEGSTDAQLLLDMDARAFIDSNTAAVMMLGLDSRAEVLGTDPAELSPPVQADGRASDAAAEQMIELARHNGFHRFEWTHSSRARAPFPVDVLLTLITEGPPALAVVTWRDLTAAHRVAREQELAATELADRNAELARFNRAAIGRELRMIELKREADALRVRLGEPTRHPARPDAESEGEA